MQRSKGRCGEGDMDMGQVHVPQRVESADTSPLVMRSCVARTSSLQRGQRFLGGEGAGQHLNIGGFHSMLVCVLCRCAAPHRSRHQ